MKPPFIWIIKWKTVKITNSEVYFYYPVLIKDFHQEVFSESKNHKFDSKGLSNFVHRFCCQLTKLILIIKNMHVTKEIIQMVKKKKKNTSKQMTRERNRNHTSPTTTFVTCERNYNSKPIKHTFGRFNFIIAPTIGPLICQWNENELPTIFFINQLFLIIFKRWTFAWSNFFNITIYCFLCHFRKKDFPTEAKTSLLFEGNCDQHFTQISGYFID